MSGRESPPPLIEVFVRAASEQVPPEQAWLGSPWNLDGFPPGVYRQIVRRTAVRATTAGQGEGLGEVTSVPGCARTGRRRLRAPPRLLATVFTSGLRAFTCLDLRADRNPSPVAAPAGTPGG